MRRGRQDRLVPSRWVLAQQPGLAKSQGAEGAGRGLRRVGLGTGRGRSCVGILGRGSPDGRIRGTRGSLRRRHDLRIRSGQNLQRLGQSGPDRRPAAGRRSNRVEVPPGGACRVGLAGPRSRRHAARSSAGSDFRARSPDVPLRVRSCRETLLLATDRVQARNRWTVRFASGFVSRPSVFGTGPATGLLGVPVAGRTRGRRPPSRWYDGVGGLEEVLIGTGLGPVVIASARGVAAFLVRIAPAPRAIALVASPFSAWREPAGSRSPLGAVDVRPVVLGVRRRFVEGGLLVREPQGCRITSETTLAFSLRGRSSGSRSVSALSSSLAFLSAGNDSEPSARSGEVPARAGFGFQEIEMSRGREGLRVASRRPPSTATRTHASRLEP